MDQNTFNEYGLYDRIEEFFEQTRDRYESEKM